MAIFGEAAGAAEAGATANLAGSVDDMAIAGSQTSGASGFSGQYIMGRAIYEYFAHHPFLGGVAGAVAGVPGIWQKGITVPFVNFPVPGPQEMRQRGLITGQGYGAGYKSYLAGVKMGLNPFDVISQGMAQQIQVATAEQGFKGTQANDIANATATLVKSLGIDYTAALNLVSTNVKKGSTSLKDFVSQMKDLHGVAKETGQSISMVVEGVQSYTNQIVTAGGKPVQPSANATAVAISRALPGIGRLGEGPQFLQGLGSQESQYMLVAMSGQGVNPIDYATAAGQRASVHGLQSLINQWARSGQSASHIYQFDPRARQLGLDAAGVADLLKRQNQGQGFIQKYTRATTAAVPTPPSKGHSLLQDLWNWTDPNKAVDYIASGINTVGRLGDSGTAWLAGQIFGDWAKSKSAKNKPELAYIDALNSAMKIPTLHGVISASQRSQLLKDLRASVGTKNFNQEASQTFQRIEFYLDPAVRKMFRTKTITSNSKALADKTGKKTITTTGTNPYNIIGGG